jgi:hypothetical protein
MAFHALRLIYLVGLAMTSFAVFTPGPVRADGGVTLTTLGDGWAADSVNVTSFRNDPITTAGDQQFAAYYNGDRHVVIAHRKLGESKWDTAVTGFVGNTLDAHNDISMIADGDGYLHLSWDHHNNRLHYARSKMPFSAEMEVVRMTGQTEGSVTYPQFFAMPDGNLVFMYRDGSSGKGNLVINRYDTKAKKWTQLYANLIGGEGKRNAYWQACVDPKGAIHVSWVWRESPLVESNHDMCYARSTDGGQTWTKSDGTPYTLPITAENAEIASAIPQHHDLINQTAMCTDSDGRPVIATYLRPDGEKSVQYVIIRYDGEKWQTMQITHRTGDFSLSGGGSKAIPISRPQVFARSAAGKTSVWVVYRDIERGSRVSLASCDDLKNPDWKVRDLTDFPVRFWEPSYDHIRWQRDGVLDLFVQMAGQGDGEKLEEIRPQPARVLEFVP